MRTSRRLLLRFYHDPGYDFSQVEIEYVDRGAPDDRSKVQGDRIVALAGNPNVGKSTVFNALTGLNQHTGNWPGKTVTNASGKYRFDDQNFILVDLPGTYSLMAGSAEEEAARDFICFGDADVVVVVADATCLERNSIWCSRSWR
jgi:ferrous iron transport protein B